MSLVTLLDIAGVVSFFCAWVGYTAYAENPRQKRRTLMANMEYFRLQWMLRMAERDNRVVDSMLIGNLNRSVTFLASTSVLVVAGLLAILGALDTAISVVSTFKFAAQASRDVWELKLLMLVLIFVYAFFKFTWSLRLFNYTSVMIGAMPETNHDAFAEKAGQVCSMAGRHFNRGLRAYYFGLAGLSWFLHPALFFVATVWVIWVLYRREFLSESFVALNEARTLLESAEKPKASGDA